MPDSAPPAPRARARDLGVVIGALPTGATNGIVDVAGVRVGHTTVWHDEPHVARTGVTVIVPDAPDDLFDSPIAAGTAVLNGAGELTGSLAIAEWGVLETPIGLATTMTVGRAYDGIVQAMIAAHDGSGVADCIIPVVGECDDSWLDDARALSVTAGHGRRARERNVERGRRRCRRCGHRHVVPGLQGRDRHRVARRARRLHGRRARAHQLRRRRAARGRRRAHRSPAPVDGDPSGTSRPKGAAS